MTERTPTENGVRRAVRQNVDSIDVSAIGLVVPDSSVDKVRSIRAILDYARQ